MFPRAEKTRISYPFVRLRIGWTKSRLPCFLMPKGRGKSILLRASVPDGRNPACVVSLCRKDEDKLSFCTPPGWTNGVPHALFPYTERMKTSYPFALLHIGRTESCLPCFLMPKGRGQAILLRASVPDGRSPTSLVSSCQKDDDKLSFCATRY